jgi:hypothetical protein
MLKTLEKFLHINCYTSMIFRPVTNRIEYYFIIGSYNEIIIVIYIVLMFVSTSH